MQYGYHIEATNSNTVISTLDNLRSLNMIICKTKSEVREALQVIRDNGERIGAVPTMGALHNGHLSLVEKVKSLGGHAVASIFVNPLQFGPHEDFSDYPRTLDSDLALLKAQGCDVVFTPAGREFVSADFSTKISVAGLGEGHCANSRPQFFDGVATIVTKLLNVFSPDFAVFGEKDYQQLMVITQLVRDLDLDIEIIGAPTVRESDGLAMSSRNEYLSPNERSQAAKLFETLNLVAEKIAQGSVAWADIQKWAIARLETAGFANVDYINYVDAMSLEPILSPDQPGRLLAAAWMGKTRLIDNIPIARRIS